MSIKVRTEVSLRGCGGISIIAAFLYKRETINDECFVSRMHINTVYKKHRTENHQPAVLTPSAVRATEDLELLSSSVFLGGFLS